MVDEALLLVSTADETEELFAEDEVSLLPVSLVTLLSFLEAELFPPVGEQAVTAKEAANISPNNFLFIKPPL